MRSGIRIESESVGKGREATRDDAVVIRWACYLNRGELVRSVERDELVLSDRNVIAGLRYGAEGMRVGGQRHFRVSPHLAYREQGVPGVIPHDAVLIFDVALLEIRRNENDP